MTDENTVRIDVSPSLHPESISKLGAILGPESGSKHTASAFAAAQGALKGLYEGLGDLETANTMTRAKFSTSPQVVDGAKIGPTLDDAAAAALAGQMDERFGKCARQFDQSFKQVSETIDQLSTLVDRALTSPKKDAMAASAASDIRRYIAALPNDGKRMDFIHGAIEAGDVEVISAVLSTNSYVSGLSKAHIETVRDLASKKFAPIERSQLDAARALGEHLGNASKIFVERYRKIRPVVREDAHSAAVKKLKGA